MKLSTNNLINHPLSFWKCSWKFSSSTFLWPLLLQHSQNADIMDSQNLDPEDEKIKEIVPCDSIIVLSHINNSQSNSSEEAPRSATEALEVSSWSSNSNWTQSSEPSPSINSKLSCQGSRCRFYSPVTLSLLATLVILLFAVIGLSICLLRIHFYPSSVPDEKFIAENITTVFENDPELPEFPLSPIQLRNVSKQSWYNLQRNNEDRFQSHVNSFPEKLTLSISKDKVHRVPCGGPPPSMTPCCHLVKTMETLKVSGCLPIQVPKHTCNGGCDYVYVDGNPFKSIPTCLPVKTRKFKINLTCGTQLQKTTVEVISKCRCA